MPTQRGIALSPAAPTSSSSRRRRTTPVLLALFSATAAVTAGDARADTWQSYEAWQKGWSKGVHGRAKKCIKRKLVKGKACGSADSLAIEVENTCKYKVRVHACLETADKKLSCGVHSGLEPDQTERIFTCHASGRWRMMACATGARCRGDGEMVMRRKDSSVHLSPCVAEEIGKLARAFHKKTRRGLIITDGDRSIRDQAVQLARKLRDRENIIRLYRERDLAREVRKAWRALSAKQRRKKGVATIEKVLERQVARGRFISQHMIKGAVDLRTLAFRARDLRILRRLIAEHGIRLLDETRSRRPHYHLNVTACGR